MSRLLTKMLLLLWLGWTSLAQAAQVAVSPPPAPAAQSGLHYYVLVNRDTGAVVQRGKTGSAGVAFDQLILAPNTHYRIWVLQAATLLTGYIDVTSPSSGGKLQLPDILLGTDLSPDDDQDGLPNDAEFIVGTDPRNPDTDGDGVLDGAAVRQGLDPLNGRPVRTGIIGNAPTRGPAVDICAVNDLAITANMAAGVSVFNVFNGMSPKVIAQVDTPGPARAVSCAGNLVPVAADTAGLVVVDITDPPAAHILQQVRLDGAAQAVAAVGTVAYVGLATGYVVAIDMTSGTILGRVKLSGPAQDVALGGDTLYVLTDGSLQTVPLAGGAFQVTASVAAPGIVPNPRRRLFVGTTLAYAVHARGYSIFDLTNPLTPVLVREITTAQLGWKQIVANGSGIGVAAVGPNRSDDGPHDLSLYGLGADGMTNQFITTFTTPGLATAVAIYNGIAYVADGAAGLEVVNFLAYDNKRVPPAIGLTASFPLAPAEVEEGRTVRVTANVSDDVQVRNVEFYSDGVKVLTDGNFPFEYRFQTPARGDTKTSFTIRARATDTGGNATWTDEINVGLLVNTAPPEVRGFYPAPGVILGAANLVTAYFNKAVVPSALDSTTFQLRSAGPDKIFGTADDLVITNGIISYRQDLNAAVMTFPNNLPPGLYSAALGGQLTDASGHPLRQTVRWSFGVLGLKDSDQDGIPDDLEAALGLDPLKASTLGDGILDGDRDLDGDGLKTSWELFWGYDPRKKDSLGDGVADGLRDPDRDGLSNLQEQAAGTNPLSADSDGDGWTDEQELTAGSDPLDAASRPALLFVTKPPVSLVQPASFLPGTPGGPGGLPPGIFVAQPPVSTVLPGPAPVGALLRGTTVAAPPVGVVLIGRSEVAGLAMGNTVAKPPVSVVLGAGAQPGAPAGTSVAQPPVSVKYGTP